MDKTEVWLLCACCGTVKGRYTDDADMMCCKLPLLVELEHVLVDAEVFTDIAIPESEMHAPVPNLKAAFAQMATLLMNLFMEGRIPKRHTTGLSDADLDELVKKAHEG